jgi:hypothetical protein
MTLNFLPLDRHRLDTTILHIVYSIVRNPETPWTSGCNLMNPLVAFGFELSLLRVFQIRPFLPLV